MFGYVKIDKLELKVRDYEVYSGFYCGVCHELGKRYGIKGQISLNYDLTFLAILLSALYDNKLHKCEERCMVHPFKKHTRLNNCFTAYAADMNILLTYYKCRDDWKDDRKLSKGLYGKLLKKSAVRVGREYPRQRRVIKRELRNLSLLEEQNSTDIDAVAGCFGRLLATVFVYRQDVWAAKLEKMGFFLGKYIYLADACCDLKEDIKKHSYNPFADGRYTKEQIETILKMMIGECSSVYEVLPITDYNNILDNILYSGVFISLKENERKNEKERK